MSRSNIRRSTKAGIAFLAQDIALFGFVWFAPMYRGAFTRYALASP